MQIRNEATAPFDAPSFLMPIAVGITPQEQSGSGMPKIAALKTERKSLCDKNLPYALLGMKECIMPARRNPNSRKGDISLMISKICFIVSKLKFTRQK